MRLPTMRRVQLAWPKAQGEARRAHAANEAMLRAWASEAAATVLSCLTVHTAAQVPQNKTKCRGTVHPFNCSCSQLD
jgi:hypothetical protein